MNSELAATPDVLPSSCLGPTGSRRRAIRATPNLNGVDYVEVDETDRRRLRIYFLDKLSKLGVQPPLTAANIAVRGGVTVRDLRVIAVELCLAERPDQDDCMTVVLDREGDFSRYRLYIVRDHRGRPTAHRHPHFDPRYACADFFFHPDCPTDLDCATAPACPPPRRQQPPIDYLAKDYASFRQLILDRLAVVMPGWKETHVPDLGVTLVELLAYFGDYLSAYQDAIATEAYLDTARLRTSVRRHVRLVDYPMHEGNNARAWIFVHTSKDVAFAAEDIYFITGFPGAPAAGTPLLTSDLDSVPADAYEAFEPLVEPETDAFRVEDVRDPEGLIARLRDGQDAAGRALRGRLSAETTRLLGESAKSRPPSEALLTAVVADLNRLMNSTTLVDDPNLRQAAQRRRTLRLLSQPLQGADLVRLNKLLLEDALAGQLSSSGRIYLYEAHNAIPFYLWEETERCLPSGATSATLCDEWADAEQTPVDARPAPQPAETGANQVAKPTPQTPQPLRRRRLQLRAGDLVLFEEVRGAKTGDAADADPAHRHVVRLTRVQPTADPVTKQPLLEIEWDPADALPFPLCLRSTGAAPDCADLTNVSIARGNLVWVDHGRTVTETLDPAPPDETRGECDPDGCPPEATVIPGRFAPRLRQRPLVYSEGLTVRLTAAAFSVRDPRKALPSVRLYGPAPAGEGGGDERWYARADLLASDAEDPHFAVETDEEGRATLRFGDGLLGRRPEAGTVFTAVYRTGLTAAGNVGAETITYFVHRRTRLDGIRLEPRNPLPAWGGQAPESVAEVKLLAPSAFRKVLMRAVTASDYAAVTARDYASELQGAAGDLRWTGSWYEAEVALDARGREEAGPALRERVDQTLHRYRRIGHDVAVRESWMVALDIALRVCVKPGYQQAHVRAALLDAFSIRQLADGARGFFHPDNLTFGEGVAASRLVAVAQAVPGVESVTVCRLERLGVGDPLALTAAGQPICDDPPEDFLPLGALEIARLDNDPSFPEHGRLTLYLEGGR